ncbi:MAG TPA: DUF4032 domain-containing protein [Pyrinomonadaceae bacterium]|nr:DUF4032 domain-containing protein [Pyrinomonadaceae bacterium]
MSSLPELGHVIGTDSERWGHGSLSGANPPRGEAREVWLQILEHKWYLSERCGRDVGIKVAAVHYFENVRRVRKRDQVRATPPPTLPYMRPLGYR